MHAYERHAYEMAPVRGTPMKWPVEDAHLWEIRLWDGLCEKHAYERHAYGDGLLEMHVYKSYHSRKRLLEKPASLTVFLPAVTSGKEDL